MGNKTIYVREEETALWERAERYAGTRRLSMSALVMTAVERFLDAEEGGISVPARVPEDDYDSG